MESSPTDERTELSTVTAVLSPVAALAVLAGTYWLISGLVSLLVDRTVGRVAGLAIVGVVALAGWALGRGGGWREAARITAYLAATTAVALVLVGLVWTVTFLLVGLPLGALAGLLAATLVAGGVALVGLVGLAGTVRGDTPTNWSLTLRMAASLVLLVLCSLVFVGAIWTLVLLPTLLALPPLVAVYVAGAVAVVGLWYLVRGEVGRAALEARADATVVSAEDAPALHDRVTRVAAQLDVPAPAVAVADHAAPEAMVVGLRPSESHLVLSTGVIDALDGAELDAVIAHELAHVANRDAAVMTLVSVPLVVADGIRAKLLGRLGVDETTGDMTAEELWGEDGQWRVTEPGPLERRLQGDRVGVVGWLLVVVGVWTAIMLATDDGDSRAWSVRVVAAAAVVALLVCWLVARVVVAVFSRARETAADRTAVAVTGSPAALASALRALDERMDAAPTEDLRQVSSVSALSILPIDRGVLRDTHGSLPDAPGVVTRLRHRLFGTHPRTEARIDALREMARDGED